MSELVYVANGLHETLASMSDELLRHGEHPEEPLHVPSRTSLVMRILIYSLPSTGSHPLPYVMPCLDHETHQPG